MQRFRLPALGAVALAVSSLIGACDSKPSAPTAPRLSPSAPITTPRLEIAGVDSVAPGESVQFRAISHQSDGSTRDVTGEATWQSGNPAVLTISTSGLATGRERGDGSLSVSASGTGATKPVVVLPTGTYRLAGRVREGGDPVPDARVDVTAGTGLGLATTTNDAGDYRLYGVAGSVEVRVIRDGYLEQRKNVLVMQSQTLDFDLTLSRPLDQVAGTYTLTVSPAADCRDRLPIEARVRTYAAVLRQDGRRLGVTLDGSRFYAPTGGPTLNSFRGNVEPNRVTFYLSAFDPYSIPNLPDVLEELPTTQLFLSVSGSAVTTVTAHGLSGSLSGAIDSLKHEGPSFFSYVGTCDSTGHQFVFSR